jgi:hypothetical protein
MTGIRPVAAAVAGVVLGAIVSISLQGGATDPGRAASSSPRGPARPPPQTFLAWVPGGLPRQFDDRVRELAVTGSVATVAEDHAWLTGSRDARGAVVERTRAPYRIPVDTIAVDPRSFAVFLGSSERRHVEAIRNGAGVLSATSASLRGIGVGGELRFAGGRRVPVAAVLPDEALGGAELLVSAATGRAIEVHHDRYVLVRPAPGATLRSATLRPVLQALLDPDLGPLGRVQVRTAAETPLLRPGDAVMSTAQMKVAFGEFAARREPGRPGYLDLEPAWTARHLVTDRLPLLGKVTCHEAVMPQLTGAMRELRRRGIGSLVETFDGCFAPRFIARDPAGLISHHSWGVAVDLNIAGNYTGARPHQSPRLVAVMERWGFQWGGRFIVPDGNHFEYRRDPA